MTSIGYILYNSTVDRYYLSSLADTREECYSFLFKCLESEKDVDWFFSSRIYTIPIFLGDK